MPVQKIGQQQASIRMGENVLGGVDGEVAFMNTTLKWVHERLNSEKYGPDAEGIQHLCEMLKDHSQFLEPMIKLLTNMFAKQSISQWFDGI